MRYLLPYSMTSEMLPRKKYLFDSLHLWTKLFPISKEFMCLEGFPVQELDIFFIIGHNFMLKKYISNNLFDIYESTIIAITCDGKVDFSSLNINGKTLYIPHQNQNNLADLLDGSMYGFNFDLTESEILFYNSRKSYDIKNRLDFAFTQLQ